MNFADTKEHKAGMAVTALALSVDEVAGLILCEPALMQRDAKDIRLAYDMLGGALKFLEKKVAA